MYKFCNSPYTSISIHSDGTVSPCICRTWQTKGVIGNLHEHSLQELFSSEWIKDFRDSIVDQSFRYCSRDFCGKIWNLDEVEDFGQIQHFDLPTNIFLQNLDLSCNLACPSCRLEHYYVKERNPNADFVLNSLKTAYRSVENPVRITGDGEGEMLASQSYLRFFEASDLPGCFRFSINTNGNLLTKRLGVIDKLGKQLSDVNVCFDASNQETYKKVRGGNLELVKAGVRELVARGIRVTAQFVVQKSNYREILEYRDMCIDLGVQFIGLQRMTYWPHMSHWWWNENELGTHNGIDYHWLIPALEEFKNTPGVDTGIEGGLETLLSQKEELVTRPRPIIWIGT